MCLCSLNGCSAGQLQDVSLVIWQIQSQQLNAAGGPKGAVVIAASQLTAGLGLALVFWVVAVREANAQMAALCCRQQPSQAAPALQAGAATLLNMVGPEWCDLETALPQHLCYLQETHPGSHEARQRWQPAHQPAPSARRRLQGTVHHGPALSGICSSCPRALPAGTVTSI